MADFRENFKLKTVQNSLQLHFKDEKTKVNSDALILVAELLRVFSSENTFQMDPPFVVHQRMSQIFADRLKNHLIQRKASERAAEIAKKDDSKLVTVEHVEKILPQLLLDI